MTNKPEVDEVEHSDDCQLGLGGECDCPAQEHAPDAVEFHSLDELCDMDAGQKNSYVIELQTEITRLRAELDAAHVLLKRAGHNIDELIDKISAPAGDNQ